MFKFNSLHRSKDDNKFYALDLRDRKIAIDCLFPPEQWDSVEAFKQAGIRGYEPMTAKELETEEMQDEKMNDPNYFIEEKFDGTRALVYFLSDCDTENEEVGYCRVFSRRISKKTGFYVENTDSLPHIRETNVPELAGTILDGEMFINGLPFKEVSSTLNCLWDKAVDRQIEKGFISFHAFDILFYHGVDLRKMPLYRRKVYLGLAVKEANNQYIEEVPYYDVNTLKDSFIDAIDAIEKRTGSYSDESKLFIPTLKKEKDTYPNLYNVYSTRGKMTPRAFYELIVATGGEGLIVKPKNGKYLHKRGWEYSKVKKFLTRELVIVGFDEPTREYTGKDIKNWGLWERDSDHTKVTGNFYKKSGYTPVTKFYFNNQVGNLLLAVLIHKDVFSKIPLSKRGTVYLPTNFGIDDPRMNHEYVLMQVCECAGFDDETRQFFTDYKDSLLGRVAEIKANELFRDTGKMRHPRFLRLRSDKNAEQCTWEDHIGASEVTK